MSDIRACTVKEFESGKSIAQAERICSAKFQKKSLLSNAQNQPLANKWLIYMGVSIVIGILYRIGLFSIPFTAFLNLFGINELFALAISAIIPILILLWLSLIIFRDNTISKVIAVSINTLGLISSIIAVVYVHYALSQLQAVGVIIPGVITEGLFLMKVLR
jgi:hypothetical protein